MTKKPIIIRSKYLKDEDIHKLWKILGRIADDKRIKSVNPSENAETFIGLYDD